jgi:hypothetical protein
MRPLSQTLAFTIWSIAACGGDDGNGGGDAQPPDSPVSVPAMITVTGTASARGVGSSTPVEGVAVGAFRTSDEATPVVSTTTDAQGMYTLVIPTNNMPVDGFIKATKSGFADTYLYPPAPLVADFAGGSINMLSNEGQLPTYDLSYTFCTAGTVDPSKGIIGVIVNDSSGTPVAGATTAADPAATKSCYTDGTNPSGSATATAADGVALMFNVLGNETVSATKSGLTFKSHTVKAFPNSFTTTLIVQ